VTRPIEIRPLRSDDVDAIENIERASMPAPWSRTMFAGEIAKPTSICLGAFADARLVGYMIVSRYVDAWHVMNIVVSPGQRRRGIATLLIQELFDVTGDDAQRGYTLEVRVSNEGAIRLYETMGFRSQGIRRGYYTDNREDALIMWRDSLARDTGKTRAKHSSAG
jgi:[ribosomal protein S18]-alanine N-acetyltransferase